MSQVILKEVSEKVAQFTGWEKVEVTLVGDVLNIECEQYALLRYNLRNGQELYGRVRQVGFNFDDLKDLELRLLK
jgi:hypothetical protein